MPSGTSTIVEPLPDDGMNPDSSAQDPLTSTVKPEIAAYGTIVQTTVCADPWIGICSGTSLAAPMVAGIAALSINRSPQLADEPEALKAMILLSGAAHNVEGDRRLSEVDGAGAVAATAAAAGFYIESLTPDVFSAGHRYEIESNIPVTLNVPLRVTMAYSHPPTSESAYPAAASYNKSDLDLELYMDGSMVASSCEGNSPFEIIDYTPTTTGVVRMKVRAANWHPSVNVLRVGFAYASVTTLGTSP